ncbi:MAG: hypothetical protein ABFD89_09020 [Bryobacteraceae bacterium]
MKGKLSREQREFFAAVLRDAAAGERPDLAGVLQGAGWAPASSGLMTLAELSKATGLDKAQLCRYASKGMPSSGSGRERRFDLEVVKSWLSQRPRAARKVVGSAAASGPGSAPIALTEHERKLIACLQSPDSPSLERTRAGAQLAALALARGYQEGAVAPRMLEDLKRQAEELRKAEQDYVELAMRQGELIELARAVQISGDLAARLVQAGENLERDIARQVEVWMHDDAFRALDADERSRKIRQVVRQTCHDVRRAEVGEITRMLEHEEDAG